MVCLSLQPLAELLGAKLPEALHDGGQAGVQLAGVNAI